MSISMKRALIFGAAGVGIKAKKKLEQDGIEVVAFSDNDQWKWHKELEKTPIIPPQDICIADYDLFAIGMYKHIETVKEQLMSMGVKEDNIIVPISVPVPSSIFYNNVYEQPMPDSQKSKYLVMIWGGIDFAGQDIQNMLKNFPRERIDFHNNFWAFQYFIEDCLQIENKDLGKRFFAEYSVTDYKSLCIDVIIVEDAGFAQELKRQFGSKEHVFFLSDSSVIHQMLVNENTIRFWQERLPRALEPEFLNRIEKLKEKMKQYNVPIEDICVVSGAVLEAYGLRESKKSDDLDIIMTDKFRELYGKDFVTVSEEIEMHPQNEVFFCRDSNISVISDDDVIAREENHFWLRGVKFLTLDLLYHQKKVMVRKGEVRRMDYFYRRSL